ncbi:NAD(P)-binding domain-containing protein [Pseudobacillus badius]|uniref:NAD(P)-binding domain-containing protein n=1 Tax=Bacillus badius TaxID=1455 RepID=UPI000B283540|nr:NAD(P)-binding domain-containing protein [Bacillus badius]
MEKIKIGLAGMGMLGTAMMHHWCEKNREIGVYHPEMPKARQFVGNYPNGYTMNKKEMSGLDILVLALPAKEVLPFLRDVIAENGVFSGTAIINMATALHTIEIKKEFPQLSVWGVKFMGHAADLFKRGEGLFITESLLPDQVKHLFFDLGEMKRDSEETVMKVNKLATYYAVKTAVEIETEFAKQGLDPQYAERALRALSPEVMRSYSEGSLGHFGKEVVKELKVGLDNEAASKLST